jgi:hypothetical protein
MAIFKRNEERLNYSLRGMRERMLIRTIKRKNIDAVERLLITISRILKI